MLWLCLRGNRWNEVGKMIFQSTISSMFFATRRAEMYFHVDSQDSLQDYGQIDLWDVYVQNFSNAPLMGNLSRGSIQILRGSSLITIKITFRSHLYIYPCNVLSLILNNWGCRIISQPISGHFMDTFFSPFPPLFFLISWTKVSDYSKLAEW